MSPRSIAITRSEKLALAAVGIGLLGSLALLVHPWFVPLADAAMYIATARSLADGEGYRFLGEPFVIRPPGFSLLLAPVIALRGNDFFAMNLWVSLFGVAGVALLYGLERERLGWPLALLVSLAVWLNPGYQSLCTSVMSDVPGLAALLGCLWLERVGARRGSGPGTGRELMLGLCIGAASLVRSANVLLVPAIVLARWLRSGRGPAHFELAWLRSSAVALLVLAPWIAWQQIHATPPPADQTRLLSYSTALLHVDPGDPSSPRVGLGEIAARVPLRASQSLAVLGSRMGAHVKGSLDDPFDDEGYEPQDRVDISPLHIALGALLVLCLGRELWQRREAPELFAFATLGSLLLYFGFQDRLALPLYVLGLPATVAASRELCTRGLGARTGLLFAAAAVVLLIARDFEPRAQWAAAESAHRSRAAASASVANELEPDARVAAWRGFHHGVFLERPVYSLHRAVRREGVQAGIESVIERYDIDTIFLTTKGLPRVKEHLQSRFGAPRRVSTDSGQVALVWKLGRRPRATPDPARSR